jgi:hypothetical protein
MGLFPASARFTVRFISVRTPSILALSLVLFAPPSLPAFGQQGSPDPFPTDQVPAPLPHAPGSNSKNLPDDEPVIRMQKEMEKKMNEERQLQLQSDTDKLYKLATELKEQVAKSNQNILSLDVIKKADEIEKLAHSVKEKMKGPS